MTRLFVTRLMSLLAMVLVLLMGALPSSALATNWSVRFCANLALDYNEYVDSPFVDDDFLIDNDTIRARGVYFEVWDNYTAMPVYDQYTPENGTWQGCTSLLTLVSSPHTYQVKFYSEASIASNYVTVVTDTFWQPYVYTGFSTYVATSSPVNPVDITAPTGAVWNDLAAASEAIEREPAGITNTTYSVVNGPCPHAGGGNCLMGGRSYIDDWWWKYITAHEIGHQVMYNALGNLAPVPNYGASPDNCYTDATRSWETTQKEFQAAAAIEGFGDFYAAAAFNDSSGTHCQIGEAFDLDWDQDRDTTHDPIANIGTGAISCEGGVTGSATPVDAHDYLGDFCLISGWTNNRATTYDYLRFLWDLHTDEGLSVDDILAVYVEADPMNWTLTGIGTGAGYPAYELNAAAGRLSVSTEWNNQDHANGVDR